MAFIGGDRMKKVAVKELTHEQITWFVELAERRRNGEAVREPIPNYCADWSKAGPIIERERIYLREAINGSGRAIASSANTDLFAEHSNMLVAAMACYVLATFGDTVELPE